MALERIPLSVEFSRNPELNLEDLEHFRDWVDKQPHLPDVSDGELVLILHRCHYRLEAAKSTLDTYYTVRTHVPEFFADRDPNLKEMQLANSRIGMVHLPGRTPEGYGVLWVRIFDSKPSHLNITQVIKVFMMLNDLWLMSEGTAPGFAVVIDMTGSSLGHLAHLPPGSLMKAYFYVQEAWPVRLKSIHFINVVPFVDKLMAVLGQFMKKELREMHHLHTEGISSLYEFVPQAMTPEDYGGQAPAYKKLHELNLPRLLANQEWLRAEEKLRVEEVKRPGKAKTSGDLFGMEGTFKKLDID